MKMHLIPCGSYQAHYLGQPGLGVPQDVVLPTSSETTQQTNPSQTSQANSGLRRGRSLMARDWTVEEDNTIVASRRKGLAWTAISKKLPGRTYFACRLRFQNCLSRPYQWNGDRQTAVAGHYERQNPRLWSTVPRQSAIPWQATDTLPWRNVEQHMADRATASRSPKAGAERDIIHCQTSQTITTSGASLPGIAGGRGPPRKQKISLPPIRDIFPSLCNSQWLNQQPPQTDQGPKEDLL